MGQQLRAYWNLTVQEEVETRFNRVGGASCAGCVRVCVCAPCVCERPVHVCVCFVLFRSTLCTCARVWLCVY